MFCSDPQELLKKIITERNIPMDTVDVHVGLDGGQGWLKVGLIVTDRSKEEVKGRAHYSEVY